MRRNDVVRAALACALSCLCAAPSWAAGARFWVSPDTLRADGDGMWHTSISLENPGDAGIYADSLYLDMTNADADSSAQPRRSTRSLEGLMHVMGPTGAGETTGFEWTAPADFVTGTLHFRLYAHDAHKQPIVLETNARVIGSEFDDAHPSRVVGTPGTEVIVVAADSAARPAPVVVLVLEPGTPARSQLRATRALTQRGYAAVLVSAPGWGRSRGTSDRSGPADVAAAEAGILTAAKEPGMDATRIALWGHGRGGTTALLAGIKHPELAGIVAVDASLDPATEYASLKGAERDVFIKVVGRNGAEWKSRSPVAQADKINAPVLIVQTEDAPIKDTSPAEEFASRRTNAQLFVESRLNGKEANPVRRRDGQRLAMDFLGRRTHKAGR